MKKLSIIVSIVLAAACLYASCYTCVFAAEVYTTVIPAKYVAEDLQTELEVAETDESFPAGVVIEGTAVPAPNSSKLPLGTLLSVTDYAEIHCKPVANSVGAIYYVKAPDNQKETHLQLYPVIKDSNGEIHARYQWGYTSWYILNKDSKDWEEIAIENYGPTLPAGFEGYVYIPNERVTLPTSITASDEYVGCKAWYPTQSGTPVVMSAPIVVTSSGLKNGKPTADKVTIGDTSYDLFEGNNSGGDPGNEGNDDYDIGKYEGEKINYGATKITSLKTTKLAESVHIGQPISTNAFSDWDADSSTCTNAKAIDSAIGLTKHPSFSLTRKTGSIAENSDILASFHFDSKTNSGAESVLFYVKMPSDSPTKLTKLLFNFTDPDGRSVAAFIYSGMCSLMEKGSDTWTSAPIDSYYFDLPAGFEGYIRFDYSSLYSPSEKPITSDYSITTAHIYIPETSGSEIVLGLPLLVTENNNSGTAVYLNGDTNAARDIFTGAVLKKEDVIKEVNIGDTIEALPDYTTLDYEIHTIEESDYSGSSLHISWDAYPGAASYRAELYKKTSNSVTYELNYILLKREDTKAAEITFDGLEENVQYAVLVTALDSAGDPIAIYDYANVSLDNSDGGIGDITWGDGSTDDDGFWGDGSTDDDGFGNWDFTPDNGGLPKTGQKILGVVSVVFAAVLSMLAGFKAFLLIKRRRNDVKEEE